MIKNIIKNPYINALLAALYIVLIVLVLGHITDVPKLQGTLLLPMTMLSLFVLSAATMGVIFVYTPAKMFLDNQKEEALVFFLKTLGTFALFVATFLLLLIFVL